MPRVRRTRAPQHIVVVDTNILWDKDKRLPVCTAFDEFWNRNSPLIPMTLYVPEVVFGELHFQQTTSALKLLSSINESFSELAGITSAPYTHKCNEVTIKGQVRVKLEKWLKGHSGHLVSTPVSTIDWPSVVEAAVWRKPPFTFDPKDAKNEKGFRDAVILESLAHTCLSGSSGKTVIFVCNDYLLRTTAESRLKGSKKFLAFESLADFEAYINLTQQQLTNAFVKAIQSHARAKFYAKGDENCIYVRHDLSKKIQDDYSADLAYQGQVVGPLTLLTQGVTSSAAQMVRHLFWIRSTQFSKLEGTREFHWVTRIDVVRLYDVASPQGLMGGTMPIKQIQVVGFDVKWKSNVKADGRFHDIQLAGIEKKDTQLFDSTEENLAQWRLV